MRRRVLAGVVLSGLAGCGGLPVSAPGPSGLCAAAKPLLKGKLGPELGQITKRIPLPVRSGSGGGGASIACLVTYTMVPEEVASDGVPVALTAAADQQIAMITQDASGSPALHLIGVSASSNGPVMLQLGSKDVDADGQAEFVIQEDGTTPGESYRGLRIFRIEPGAAPAEVFSEALKVTTPEGLDLIAEWKAGQAGGKRAIVLQGAGVRRIFTWSEGAKRFEFNDAATKKFAPKAVTPATPATPAVPDATAIPGLEDASGAETPPGDEKGEVDPTAIPLP